MRIDIFAFLMFLAAAFPQASPAEPVQAAVGTAARELTGTVWKWNRSLSSDGSLKAPGDPNRYLIEFTAAGSVSIQADCNRVLATYRADGSTLTILPGPSTLAACPPGSLESDYVKHLGMVNSYFLRDGSLLLEFKYDSGTMTFTPSAPAGLAGTTWNFLSYNNGKQAVVSIAIGSTITLGFAADGKVGGNGGCNDFTGGYESTAAALKIGQLAGTRKACAAPNGVMDQEALFLRALGNATTYKIEGSRLTLRDASGAMQVLAVR
jgi:heat shock protein HslJ